MIGRGARVWLVVASCLILAGLSACTRRTASAVAESQFPPVLVTDVQYDATLRHNIPNVQISRGGAVLQARFLEAYQASGGLERWGYATSEVMEEEEGSLTQYYQRGVLDWHASPTCGTSSGFCLERRLVWDYFGGGLGGSTDLGVESGVTNPNAQTNVVGTWGHGVADLSIEGTPTHFQEFFNRLGGVEAFGFPKTDARIDRNQPGMLYIADATPGFIRQYFQAAVMEYHANDPEPVKLRLLGDDLRDSTYPDGAWKAYASFRSGSPVSAGAPMEIERVPPGPRAVEARIEVVNPITERCSAATWHQEVFCGSQGLFQSALPGLEILTGDVVRTRNASPDYDVHAVIQQLIRGLVAAISVLQTGDRASFSTSGVRIIQGSPAIATQPGSAMTITTPDGVVDRHSTIMLVSVRQQPDGSTITTVKVVSGEARFRAYDRVETVAVSATEPSARQVRMQRGVPPLLQVLDPLTSGERAQVALLQQLEGEGRFGQPPRPIGLLPPSTGTATPTPSLGSTPTALVPTPTWTPTRAPTSAASTATPTPTPSPTPVPPSLSVTLSDNRGGSVSSSPSGINCPASTCRATFPSGSTVTLRAAATSSWTFRGWTDATGRRLCANSGTSCAVTMNGDQTVTAVFGQG